MPNPGKHKKLKKELTLINVYAIATGTTLSAGFFLLPGLAAAQAGPAVIFSYMLAAVPLIPAMFCMVELATAMPRAGGAYYFLDRSMGPLIGTIGGLGTWLSLMLKTAFALIGMGAYLNLFIPGNEIILYAIGFAVFFGIVNVAGAKETGRIQVFLVGGIVSILVWFISKGLVAVELNHFTSFFERGPSSILATAGFVYISYVGVTKVASVAEEVKNPERNLPLGMFLAFGTAILIYGLGIYVMVGVVPMEELQNSLTPVALTAEYLAGFWGNVLVTIAAIFAFSSVTNAGIMSASRYPLAMSRDHLFPRIFRKLNKRHIPFYSILLTLFIIIIFIVFLNPIKIAKLASAFQLLMFALCCLAVIIMRESHIQAYDPGYMSPFYPWMQIAGIVAPFILLKEMGWSTIGFSAGLIVLGIVWYFYYAHNNVQRGGAVLHVFERLGRGCNEKLEIELRGILKEKGLRDQDPFDVLVAQAHVLELDGVIRFDEVIKKASALLGERLSYPAEKIEKDILEGNKIGGTPISHGVALPHMRLQHIIEPNLLVVRSKSGISVDIAQGFWGEHPPKESLYAVFFLISSEENPRQHLRILAKIAGRIDDESFMEEWNSAKNEQELKEILLRDERFVSMVLHAGTKGGDLIGKPIRDVNMPEETLIAIIHRDGKTIVPRGDKVLREGDSVTVIGDKKGISQFRKLYGFGRILD